MKKVLLGLVLLLVIAGGIFYKQILATIDFYQYQKEHKAEFAQATMDWEKLPFTSTTRAGVTGDALTFDHLQLPIPFAASKKVGDDAAFAFGGVQSITISRSSAAADFFTTHDFSEADQKTACAFLVQTSGRGACTANYDLYRAFLEFNKTDTHVFAPTEDKLMYNRLMLLRAEMVPSKKIAGFETSSLRGFLFTIDSGNYVAEVFDQQDQQYHLEFTNLKQSDVSFVLSNTAIVH